MYSVLSTVGYYYAYMLHQKFISLEEIPRNPLDALTRTKNETVIVKSHFFNSNLTSATQFSSPFIAAILVSSYASWYVLR